MSMGPLLQIIGIILTASGSILAISKLWQGYFQRMGDFLIRCYNEYSNADDELRMINLDLMKKVFGSDIYSIEYKKMLKNLTTQQMRAKRKKREKMIGRIRMYGFLDRNLLYIGVWFIISGAIIQIMGVAIQ